MTTASKTDIIHATLDHLDDAAPLFDAYRQFYGQPENLEAARNFLRDRLTNGESVIFLAYDANQKPIGFVQLYPAFSSVSIQRTLILNDLFVVPDARKQGIARALMNRARDYAKEAGALRLELSTAGDNHSAQALYEALGYQRDTFYHYSLTVQNV